MQPFANAPRFLVVLLSFIVLALTAHATLIAQSAMSLLWPMLVAALGLSALFGSWKAASALKYLFFLGGAVLLLGLLAGRMSTFGIAWSVGLAALYFGSASYLAKSKAVSAFYAENRAQSPSTSTHVPKA